MTQTPHLLSNVPVQSLEPYVLVYSSVLYTTCWLPLPSLTTSGEVLRQTPVVPHQAHVGQTELQDPQLVLAEQSTWSCLALAAPAGATAPGAACVPFAGGPGASGLSSIFPCCAAIAALSGAAIKYRRQQSWRRD